jgi:hypothetical protein
MLPNHPPLASLLGCARRPAASMETGIAPVDKTERIEDGRASNTPCSILPGRGRRRTELTRPERTNRPWRSFSARARQQRRQELLEFEALPLVRRARAAGLQGAALRAYVAAVEWIDGPLALTE